MSVAVTPRPQTMAYPTLLGDFPAPLLRVDPVYIVIAEKYQAMVMLGQSNSRMKDLFDLAVPGDDRVSKISDISTAATWTSPA